MYVKRFISNPRGLCLVLVAIFGAEALASPYPETNLTNHPAQDDAPAWSSNGLEIAFHSNRAGTYDIWVMGCSNFENRSGPVYDDFLPSWSPDGRIVFDSIRNGERSLYILDTDGSETPLPLPAGYHYHADWSPDGNKIAFTSWRNGNTDIYVFDFNQMIEYRLTHDPAVDEAPAWCPFGNEIAFHSDRLGNRQLYRMTDMGLNQRLIFEEPTPYIDQEPDWSPDCSQLVFRSNRTGQSEIYTYNFDDLQILPLTNDPAEDGSPAWSSNEGKIAFWSMRDGNGEIYVLDLPKSGEDFPNPSLFGPPELVPGFDGERGAGFSISPDGLYVVYSKFGEVQSLRSASRSSLDQPWGEFLSVSPLNPGGNPPYERQPSLSPDGQVLFYNSGDGSSASGRIYKSCRQGDEWTWSQGILIEGIDVQPQTNPAYDGVYLYFTTPIDANHAEIYRVPFNVNNNSVSAPAERLPDSINTSNFNVVSQVCCGGQTLIFQRWAGGTGPEDIWISNLKNGSWELPIEFEWPINTGTVDYYGRYFAPTRTLYFSRYVEGEALFYQTKANQPPHCDSSGPYNSECQGFETMIQLDSTGSFDPDGDPLTYEWETDCPEATFDDLTSPTPMLIVDTSSGMPVECTVILTVTDSSGETDSDSASVTIEACSSSDLIEDLASIVEEFNLQQGIDNSLDAKIDTALQVLDDINENNDVAAINALSAFINHVEAQRDSKLTSAQADQLVEAAQAIIDLLST